MLKFGKLIEVKLNQKKNPKTLKILGWWSKMGYGKFNIFQYTGTDGQDEKHSSQRTFTSKKKTRSKNGSSVSASLYI
jgi:hypothetical protein